MVYRNYHNCALFEIFQLSAVLELCSTSHLSYAHRLALLRAAQALLGRRSYRSAMGGHGCEVEVIAGGAGGAGGREAVNQRMTRVSR